MNNILERLTQADPLAGELPPGRPLPRSLAALQPPAEPPQRRPRRSVLVLVLVVVAATICAASAAFALIDMPKQDGSDRGSTAGQEEPAAADEKNVDARAGSTTSALPPKMTPPNIPPVPRLPPTGPMIRFTSVDSKVRGTLRLPATTTQQAHFRFSGLRRRPGREYGVWLLARNRTAKFLGFLPPIAQSDDLVGLPPEWQNYSTVVVTTERPRKRPARPGPTVASAVLP